LNELKFVEAMDRSCSSGGWEAGSAERSAVSADDRDTGGVAA
jgi:hypothetical protein